MTRLVQLLGCLVLCVTASSAEILAHRGASAEAPENTIAAAKLAFAQGAHAVECDIMRTSDGHVVLMHDKTTKRTTGVEGKIPQMTLAQVQALDAGSWKSPSFAGERIPTLEQILAVVPEGRRLTVELKGGEELLPGIAKALETTTLKPAQIEFICFDYKTLVAVKARFPQHRALWLADKLKTTLEDFINQCKAGRFEGASINHNWPIDADLCAKFKAAGLDLYVWTVNDVKRAKELAASGISAITTDKPKLMAEALGEP